MESKTPSSISQLSARLSALGIRTQPTFDHQRSNCLAFRIQRIDRDRARAASIAAGLKALRIESRPEDLRSEILIGREDEGLQLIEVNLLWNDSPLLAAQHAGSGELASGGICIAVSGGDGAGKSTAIEMLSSWLSPTFVLQQLHFGRPKPLLVSYVLYRSLGVLRRLGIDIPQPMSISEGGGSSFGFWSRLALCLQLLCVARDRRRTHERSRREVGMGGIVLCDRYPDSRISDMEGPRLANLWPSPGRWQARLLKFERECYQGFVRPDVHIILRVSPDVARQRQPEDDPDSLRRRVEAVARACEQAPEDVHVVNADAPIERVHSELRRIVWDAL